MKIYNKTKISKRIAINSKVSHGLNKIISKELDIEEKLHLISFAALYNVQNFCLKYTDTFLERELLQISETIEFPEMKCRKIENSVLHVLTTSHDIGGDTRIVNNWIEFDNVHCHSAVFIQQQGILPEWLTDNIKKANGEIYIINEMTYIEKAKELYKIALQFEKIVLNVANYDIVPLLAFGNHKWETPICLFNHSEFYFWLGASIADIVLDYSHETYDYSLRYRSIKKNMILPIPVKEPAISDEKRKDQDKCNSTKKELGLPIGSYIVTSMARSFKYTDYEQYDFFTFCNKTINIDSNIYFLIIGPGRNDARWNKLYLESNGRIIALGPQKKEMTQRILYITDYYVDSFYFPSGTCRLEALSYNIPTAVLNPMVEYKIFKEITKNDVKGIIDDIFSHFKGNYDYSKIEKVKEKLRIHYKENWIKSLELIYEQIPDRHELYLSHINKKEDISDLETYLEVADNKIWPYFSFETYNHFNIKNRFKLFCIFVYHCKISGFIRLNKLCNNFIIKILNKTEILQPIKNEGVTLDKKIAIYGTANWGRKCIKILSDEGYNVKFCIDSDRKKSGGLFMGRPIIHYTQIGQVGYEYDKILIASSAFPEIVKILKSLGISEKKIIFYNFMQ